MENTNLTGEEFTRLANNFYASKGLNVEVGRIGLDAELVNYFVAHSGEMKKKFKIAFCWICINPLYWEYAMPMINGAKQFFLPGQNTDYFLWSDMPEVDSPKGKEFLAQIPEAERPNWENYIKEVRKSSTIFETEPIEWPMPTLMRYHLFLQQEDLLKDYDYIFFCDVDMKFVNVVGDEILGKGLTAAPHPGYSIRKELWPPYEPNKKSHSYISRPGFVINDGGKPRFMPMYFAGGFQGGTSKEWFKAMRVMKDLVNKDMAQNYIPIWNDETAWNKYLEKTPEDLVMLTPSYIYPDSLIKEYYEPIVWGCSYPPKLVTLTKSFSTSKEGGEAVARMIQK